MKISRSTAIFIILFALILGLIGLPTSSSIIKSSYGRNESSSNATTNNATSSNTTTSNTTMSSSSSPSSLSSSPSTSPTSSDNSPYKFERGYPTASTVELVYNDTDLGRAIEAYKFFYPIMVTEALMQLAPPSDKPNQVGFKFVTAPRHQLLTANSDTPYAAGVLDLKADGPMVIELPPGNFIGFVNDHNTRWVLDMGNNGSQFSIVDRGRGATLPCE